MKRMTAAAFGAALAFAPAAAQDHIVYAIPDDAQAGHAYVWNGGPVANALPLQAALETAKTLRPGPDKTVEVHLLARKDRDETIYHGVRNGLIVIDGWSREGNVVLVIRGQIDRTGSRPRAITVVEGPSLRETFCAQTPDDCIQPAPKTAASSGPSEDGLDILWTQARHGPRLLTRSIGEQENRVNCIRIKRSHHVEIRDVGLRDCWLPAVMTTGSHDVALRDSVIQGSSFVFAAFPASAEKPETAHSFEITGNRWEASPGSYRQRWPGCEDVRLDWDCPVSVWADLPWGVTHGFFWEPLNGALFGARGILGNVKIADNAVIDAYNGVRVKPSNFCLTDKGGCLRRTNVGFEIARNVFSNVRDNPVEPEGHAAFWIVKQNVFKNVHAAISTDDVAGKEFFVFGNTLDFDDVPGRGCVSAGWLDSRKFKTTPAGGVWEPSLREAVTPLGAALDKADCLSHRRGAFIKAGSGDEASMKNFLDRIYVFNNSLRTRSPFLARKPASPTSSYNNAIAYVGCGRDGQDMCRQQPDPDVSCVDHRHWTKDEGALHLDCAPPEPHDFRHNVFNRELQESIGKFEKDHKIESGLFSEPDERFRPQSDILSRAGCDLAYVAGSIACSEKEGLAGAVLANGRRFDFALPFSYPFKPALDLVKID